MAVFSLAAALLRRMALREGRTNRTLRAERDAWERLARERLEQLRESEAKARRLVEESEKKAEQLRLVNDSVEIAESNAVRARAQLEAILDLALINVLITFDDKIVYANPSTLETFGVTIGDEPRIRMIDPEDRDRVVEEMEASGRSVREVRARTATGEVLDFFINASRIVFDEKPSTLVWIVDVSRLKRAERALKELSDRLQMATRAARIGVWTFHIQADKLEWDEVTHALHGLPLGEFDGTREAYWNRVHPEDKERVLADVEKALRGEADYHPEFRVVWPDGTVRHIKANAVVERDASGQLLRMVGTNWDITEMKSSEEALRAAKEAAEAATRAKSAFLANMSHEIRTPMNAVLGYAQLLLRDRSLEPRQSEQIQIIHRSGNHLLTLINDILEMSKIEAGRTVLHLSTFDPRALFEEVRLMFRELTQAKGLDLVFDVAEDLPRAIDADSGKLRQVVINLLSNAVKFTDRGRIDVRVSARVVDGARAALAVVVADTGCGIDPEYAERIFAPFEQAANSRREGGTGLGMAISRSFARLMRGDLTVESRLREGTTFTLTIDAGLGMSKPTADPPARIPLGLAPPSEHTRVLVVDDIETNRQLFASLLGVVGFDVRLAESGERALEEHARWAPQLVLMDIRMPGGMDGLEAIRRLRAAGTPAKIIAISASAFPDDQSGALAAGADEFVPKPCDQATLYAKIKVVLGIDYFYPAEEVRAPDVTASPVVSLDDAIASLPPELVAELREATVRARITRLNMLLDRVAEHRPDAANALRRMANTFQYEALLGIFDSQQRETP